MDTGTSAAKCRKPGCGAKAIKGRPCTDWDCPQHFVGAAGYATLAAENAALKALVAEMVNEAALWRQLIIVQASFVSVGDVESSPLIEDMDALIDRAKEAAS